MSDRLTIARGGLELPPAAPGELVVSFTEFREWVRRGTVLGHLGRHREGRLLVHRLETAGRPLPLGLALRALCRGRVYIEDARGHRRPLTASQLTRWAAQVVTEPFRVSALLRSVERTVADLERPPSRGAGLPPSRASADRRSLGGDGQACERSSSFNLAGSPVYLRTDLSFGVRAGGSVGHIAGVVNELDAMAGPIVFLTTDDIPTLSPATETHHVAPGEAFWNFKELPTFVLNDAFEAVAERALKGRAPAFVYQRYSLNSYAGVRLARRHGVPFVLEYNGSEIWMGRHWGRPLKYERLAERIERVNLSSADLVVVVSRAMRDEIVARGVDDQRVLVNPNGVDASRYRPEIDGTAVRSRYRLGDATVIGFIGTFGPWHGAEVLARAFVSLLERSPQLADSVRLLMIGDGATMPGVRRILAEGNALSRTALTGLVPQELGPEHLAACDVLVSPHVRNPDGTPFFGSPTKLFEYMAMGKGIIASDLDQIGEVLDHGRTGWLVEPGDAAALTEGLQRLIDDQPLRESLGAEARRRALSHHTWRQHVRRTIEQLGTLVEPRDVPVRPAAGA